MDIDNDNGLIYTFGVESVLKISLEGLVTTDKTNIGVDAHIIRLN